MGQQRTTIAINDPPIAEQFRERKPDEMRNSEYLAHLLEERTADPGDIDGTVDYLQEVLGLALPNQITVSERTKTQLQKRRPDSMTVNEYIQFLLDKRNEKPQHTEEIAEAVERRLMGQLGIEKQEIRDAARSGAKQGLREVQ